MLIENIIEEIDGSGPKSYYSFETFIQHLFKYHIEKQNKKYIINSNYLNFGDAFAPDGFDAFEGPTVIEIKFNLSRVLPRLFIDKLIKNHNLHSTEQDFSNLLVIAAKPIPINIKKKLEIEVEKSKLPFKIFFWDPQELNKIVLKNKKIVDKIINNLFSLRLETAITEPIKDWKLQRDKIVENLKACYMKGQFSLFLGAGVSSSAGMPNWNTLLNSLFVNYLTQEFDDDIKVNDKDINEIVSKLNNIAEPSALMAARYLRKGLSKKGDTQDFVNAITKALYKLRDTNFQIDSDLIKSIASMCLPKRTGAKIKSVMTYNFDDLLERDLSSKSIQYSCIYSDNESYAPDELPIYHVHGFLPEARKEYQGLNASTLVFSEEGYHQIYSEPYHWSNLVQLSAFRENHCLMIGLSMTDPNLRRLLDISSKNIEKNKHYTFMKRLSIDDFNSNDNDQMKSKPLRNVRAANKFLDRHHTLNEELMKELGVTIVWYESYDDIPNIINQVSQN